MAVEHLDFGAGFKVDGSSWGELAARPLRDARWRWLGSGVHMLHMNHDIGFRVTVNDGTGTVAALGNTERGVRLLQTTIERWGVGSILRLLGSETGVLPLIVPAQEN